MASSSCAFAGTTALRKRLQACRADDCGRRYSLRLCAAGGAYG